MSDQSSESSGEWVILNEDEEELALSNNELSLKLDLSYDAISQAVSDSIRSSFSSEDLEWQYETLQRPSFIQDLHNRDNFESEDSNVEDEIVDKRVSTSDFDDEDNTAYISECLPKVRSYKHNRNNQLNFILNLALALVFASAVGLGVGHFLGWSHKCFSSKSVSHNVGELNQIDIIEQKSESNKLTEKDKNLPLLSENLLNSVVCTSLIGEDIQVHHDVSMNSNIVMDSSVVETKTLMGLNVLELKAEEESLQNNFSNTYMINIVPESDALTNIGWKLAGLSNVETSDKEIQNLMEVSLDSANIDSVIDDEMSKIELELFTKISAKQEFYDETDVVYNSKIESSKVEKEPLLFKNKLNNNELEFLKDYFNEQKNSFGENNLTKQLKKDLNDVVQSLAAVTLAHLSDTNKKFQLFVEESESVIQLFNEFQTLINTRITEIDNFANTIEFKDASKIRLKYLQKMIYTLVDSVDYLMKVSFKTLSKDAKKLNAHKLSINISKVLFNFNKKWEKNYRFWSWSLENLKAKKHEGYSKKGKGTKYWKNNAQFEKHTKKNLKYKNTMKS